MFSLIFLTGLLRFASFYVSPDAKADAVETYNPFDPLSSLLQQGIYTLTLLLLLARWKSSLRTALRDPVILLLAGMSFLSFLWSDFPDTSFRKGIATIQTTTFGVYMASRFSLKQQLQMLAWVLGFIVIFSILFTLAFPGVAIEAGANAGSWRGPFTQKNLLSRIGVLASIVFLLLATDSNRKSYLLWGGFGISVVLILLTGSKTSLLLLLTILFLLPLYKALRWKDTVFIPLLITLTLVGGSITTFVVGNWENLLQALGRDPTLSGRTGLWELALEKISERPWLGYGYQGFWLEGGGAEIIWKAEGYKPPHAHNGFINMMLDFGLVGLFLFLLILALIYWRSIGWLKTGTTTIELWPIFYVTFFFMYNHTENTIVEHNSIFWALLVAVSLSIKKIRRIDQERSEDNQDQKLLLRTKMLKKPKFKT